MLYARKTVIMIPAKSENVGLTELRWRVLAMTVLLLASARTAVAQTITEFPIPTEFPVAAATVAAGPDGALWFTAHGRHKIGRITTTGEFSEFVIPTPNSGSGGITAGPDGAVWFTEANRARIGRIGQIDEDIKTDVQTFHWERWSLYLAILASSGIIIARRLKPLHLHWASVSDLDFATCAHSVLRRKRRWGWTKGVTTLMAELWHRLVRLWHRLPLAIKVAVLVEGLMGVTTPQVALWWFAQDQESNLALLTSAYLGLAFVLGGYFVLSSRLYPWLNRRAAMNKGMDTPAHSLPKSCRDTTRTEDSWGWKFIDLAAFGINNRRSYFVALLRIVFYPLAFSALVVAAAIVTHQLLPLSPIAMVMGVFGPVIAAGIAVVQSVTRTHRRPWLSLVSARLTLDWKRLAIGAGVQAILTSAFMFVMPFITGQPWRLAATSPVTLPILTLALLLTPLQAASEEILFRGYLTQALGRIFRSRYKIVVAVGMIFAVLHFDAYGPLTMPYMFAVSLIFSFTTLRDDRIELAIGAHTAQNCLAVVVSIDSLFYGHTATQIAWPYY